MSSPIDVNIISHSTNNNSFINGIMISTISWLLTVLVAYLTYAYKSKKEKGNNKEFLLLDLKSIICLINNLHVKDTSFSDSVNETHGLVVPIRYNQNWENLLLNSGLNNKYVNKIFQYYDDFYDFNHYSIFNPKEQVDILSDKLFKSIYGNSLVTLSDFNKLEEFLSDEIKEVLCQLGYNIKKKVEVIQPSITSAF